MMRKTTVSVSIVALVAALSLYVRAQDKSAASETAADTPHGGHAMHMEMAKPAEGAKPAMSPEEMATMCREHMKSMGMSDAMMMRHKMLSSAAVANDDPVALLAVRDDLKLTDDQTAKIASISLKARQDAKAVLTDEQKKTLDTLGGTPANMMAMCSQMRSKMGQGGQGMMCPMMGGMGKMGEAKDAQPMSCCPMMGAGTADATKAQTK